MVALALLWAVLLFSLLCGGVAVPSSFFLVVLPSSLSFVVLPSPAPLGRCFVVVVLSTTRSLLGGAPSPPPLLGGAAVLCSFEMK